MAKNNQGKNTIITFILGIFLFDKLYTANGIGPKLGWWFLKFITGGGLLIWWIVDLVTCLMGKYKVNPINYFK